MLNRPGIPLSKLKSGIASKRGAVYEVVSGGCAAGSGFVGTKDDVVRRDVPTPAAIGRTGRSDPASAVRMNPRRPTIDGGMRIGEGNHRQYLCTDQPPAMAIPIETRRVALARHHLLGPLARTEVRVQTPYGVASPD